MPRKKKEVDSQKPDAIITDVIKEIEPITSSSCCNAYTKGTMTTKNKIAFSVSFVSFFIASTFLLKTIANNDAVHWSILFFIIALIAIINTEKSAR